MHDEIDDDLQVVAWMTLPFQLLDIQQIEDTHEQVEDHDGVEVDEVEHDRIDEHRQKFHLSWETFKIHHLFDEDE